MPGGGPAGMPGGGPAGMPGGGPAGGSSACLLVTNAVDSDTSKTAKMKNDSFIVLLNVKKAEKYYKQLVRVSKMVCRI